MICRSGTRVALFAVSLGLMPGCHQRGASSHRIVAKAGIFYGGQIQNRAEWPLILDATRQTQGFRLEFAQPLTGPAQVHWEVVRAIAHQKKHAPLRDESGELPSTVVVPAGSQRFDQVIPFNDSDRPGDWKLKVAVDGATVLDKTIRVVPKPPTSSDD